MGSADPPRRRRALSLPATPDDQRLATVLAGETLLFERTGLAIWLAVFVAVNAVYLSLVEEPQLVRRFGADYERYMRHVRRWLPRLRPWIPDVEEAPFGAPSLAGL